ncbi:MAG: type II toxin-antitoxin system RelE/ParE family toxin [Proteobacteria bacterium]|nr:type II toxin-antitoxin system RelE/ParE family toxin [Pseudomonadota bacterium]
MSTASIPTGARTGDRLERWQPWIAALASVLLHALFVLVAMLAPPITVSTSGGDAAGGSRVEVNFIGEALPIPSPAPPERPAPAHAPATPPPTASRLRTTPVPRADAPLPLVVADPNDTPTPARPPRPQTRPTDAAPAGSPPTRDPRQRARTWGQPPGMLAQDHAPVNAGRAPTAAVQSGQRNAPGDAGPSFDVGGYQVVYDLRSERRLRAWRDEGMTEVFLPLPGTRQYMVCPLETALKRESGPCRLLDPKDPEMAKIGDARQVLNMMQVYRRGELVWRGPGPYR